MYLQKGKQKSQQEGAKMKNLLNKNSLNYEADKAIVEMPEKAMLGMSLTQKIYGGEFGKKRCQEIRELWYAYHQANQNEN